MADPCETLILVGHGSHLNPDSSAPVCQHARMLRETGRWEQVIEAFWKEEPSLRDALDLVRNPRAVVVPLFLAEGYFTRQVLPRELGFREFVPDRPAEVFYAAPVGTHPEMDRLIVRRAREIVGRPTGPLDDFALVVIGHGTERSRTSGDTVYALTGRIRQQALFAEVDCGFLDEDPEIGEVIGRIRAPNLVLVPFFIAEGWHTRETIPEDLGLDGEVTQRGDQTIWYAPPVGTLPEMTEAISDLATAALKKEPFRTGVGDGEAVRSARAALVHRVAESGALGVMQIVIREAGHGRFDLVHQDDAGQGMERPAVAAPSAGWIGRDLHGPLTGAELRSFALEISRFDEAGAYRPLRSAADLRAGWCFRGLTAGQMLDVVDTFYPAAMLRADQEARDRLDVVDFEPWAGRQTAMYESVRDLSLSQLGEVVRATCGPCLRHRRWTAEALPADATDPDARSLIIPCREPCTVFATEAREFAQACRKDDGGPA